MGCCMIQNARFMCVRCCMLLYLLYLLYCCIAVPCALHARCHVMGVKHAAKLTRPSVQTPAAVPNYAQTTDAAMPGTNPTSTKCELNPATCNDPCNDHACTGSPTCSPSVGCKLKLVGGRLCARREALVVSTRAASTVANFAFQTVGRNSSSSGLLRPFCVK